MSKYSHVSSEKLIEKVGPIDFSGVTSPSSESFVQRVVIPGDPVLDYPSLTPADMIAQYNNGKTKSTSDQVSTQEYEDLSNKENEKTVNITGIVKSFIFQETGNYRDQHILDMKVDRNTGNTADRSVYVLWGCKDNILHHVLMVSKFNSDGVLQASAVVAKNSGTSWISGGFSNYAGSYERTAQLAFEVGSSAGNSSVIIAFIHRSTGTHTPSFPTAGTGHGVMIVRKQKSDLLDVASDPVLEILAPNTNFFLRSVSVIKRESSATLVISATAQNLSSSRDVVMSGEVDVTNTNAPVVTALSTKLTASAGGIGYHHCKIVEMGDPFIFFSYLDSSAGDKIGVSSVNHSNSSVVNWKEHNHGSYAYSSWMSYDVIGRFNGSDYIAALLFQRRDDSNADVLYSIKTGKVNGLDGGEKVFYRKSINDESGNISGIFTEDSDAIFVISDFNQEFPTFIRFVDLQLSSDVYTSFSRRQPEYENYIPTDNYLIEQMDIPDEEELFVFSSTFKDVLSASEVFIFKKGVPVFLSKFKVGTDAYNQFKKMFASSFCSASLEFGDKSFNDGMTASYFNGSAWTRGVDLKANNSARKESSNIGSPCTIEIPQSDIQGGPPQEVYVAFHSKESGEIDDPVNAQIGFIQAYPNPLESSTIVTQPKSLGFSPSSAVVSSNVEEFNGSSLQTDILDPYLEDETFYAVESGLNKLHILNADSEPDSSFDLSLKGESIENVQGCSFNKKDGELYVVIETDQSEGNSILARVDIDNGKCDRVADLAQSISDITFDIDGSCYGIVHHSQADAGKIYRIALDGSLTLVSSGSSGDGHCLSWSPSTGLLYHMYGNPVQFESVNISNGNKVSISTSGSPSPAPTEASYLSYIGSSLFSFMTDTGGNNNEYSISESGAILFKGAVSNPLYGSSGIPVELEMTKVSGSGDIEVLSSSFPSVHAEPMKINTLSLHLKRTGTPSDIYQVNIVSHGKAENPESHPFFDDVIGSVDLDSSSVSDSSEFVDLDFSSQNIILYPNVSYSISLSRGRKYSKYYALESGADARLLRITRVGSNILEEIDLDPLWSMNGVLTTSAYAIDPTTGKHYAILKADGDAQDSICEIDPNTGECAKVSDIINHIFSDMAFTDSGILYGVLSNTSPTDPNGIKTIDKSDGTLSANLSTIGTSTAERSISFHTGASLFYINSNADRWHSFNPSGNVLTNVGQTDEESGWNAHASVWDDEEGKFRLYSENQCRFIDTAGQWSNPGAFNSPHFSGVDKINLKSASFNDASNFISWSKSAPYLKSRLREYTSFEGGDIGSLNNVRVPHSFKMTTETAGKISVSISKDNAVTWESVALKEYGNTRVTTVNSRDLEDKTIYSDHIFESSSGNQVRLKFHMNGIIQKIKSISLFCK